MRGFLSFLCHNWRFFHAKKLCSLYVRLFFLILCSAIEAFFLFTGNCAVIFPAMFLSRKSSFITSSKFRFKSSSPALERIRERLENGPSFQDFVQNPEQSKEELSKDFDGKLKKEKGDKDRLRLPPWLKTQIPIGK